MAELADALVSGTSDREVMQVQVLFSAPSRTASFRVTAQPMQFLFYQSFSCQNYFFKGGC